MVIPSTVAIAEKVVTGVLIGAGKIEAPVRTRSGTRGPFGGTYAWHDQK
jgi:hypothetical protein